MIKDKLRQILRLDETPHELAKSFAVGVFVAFTPFLGLHTVVALLLAWALRLNKAVAITGTLVNNPWTIVFVFVGPTWIAVKVMRHMGIYVPAMNYELLSAQFAESMEKYKMWQPAFWMDLIREFKPYVHAFLIGTTLAGVAAAFAAYLAAYFGIKYYRQKKAALHKIKEEAQ